MYAMYVNDTYRWICTHMYTNDYHKIMFKSYFTEYFITKKPT